MAAGEVIMNFTRCKTCCMPNTRPDTPFIDGECSACVTYKKRPTIDWAGREQDLVRLLEQNRYARPGAEFDCIVPSSGGKDSTWQVLKLLELGAKPLVVTATTCHLTPIGRRNIDNLARYATTIEVTPSRSVRARLNRLGLEMVGDISWPEHVSIFTTPFKVACQMGIPLIFYGENPQAEYGGPPGTEQAREMTRRWVSEFGGFLGLRPMDVVGLLGITERDMQEYLPPSDDAMARAGVSAYFIGSFYEWDSLRNADVACKHGMKASVPSAANWWIEENLDNAQTGLHDWFGWLKYGYGRGCAQVSVDVRAGRIPRDQALEWVHKHDGAFPREYAGVLLDAVLERIGMTRAELFEAASQFVSHELFVDGDWDKPVWRAHAG
jgi:N-acetyl sugar amidotransferase